MRRPTLTLGWRGKAERLPDIDFVEVPVSRQVPCHAPLVRQGIFVVPPLDVSPLQLCLELWKLWMAGDSDRDLGVSVAKGLAGNLDGYGRDPNEEQQIADAEIGAATNAMIDSLPRISIWAIYKSCSMATPWRFNNADLANEILVAHEGLEKKLRQNSCTSRLF